jgi:hypothetical protein
MQIPYRRHIWAGIVDKRHGRFSQPLVPVFKERAFMQMVFKEVLATCSSHSVGRCQRAHVCANRAQIVQGTAG